MPSSEILTGLRPKFYRLKQILKLMNFKGFDIILRN
jgi:hypothetical protein